MRTFPSNPAKHQLPAIQGVMLLFDARDGRPLAVMESGELTALRTAAATAVAAEYLSRPGSESVVVVGCGRQGRVQLQALRRVMTVKRAFAFGADPERARSFARDHDATVVASHTPELMAAVASSTTSPISAWRSATCTTRSLPGSRTPPQHRSCTSAR